MAEPTGKIIAIKDTRRMLGMSVAQSTIGNMSLGDVAYCVPAAVCGLEVYEAYNVLREPSDAFHVVIECVGKHQYVIGV